MQYERRNAFSKCIKLYFFPEKKKKKKIYVPTLPKIFRPVTRNTLIFFIWPKPDLDQKCLTL